MLPILFNRGQLLPETDWMDREFGRMMRRMWGDSPAASGELATVSYPVNMWEDDDALHVEAEMPGFKTDEIDITIEQGMLNISGERRESKQRGNGRKGGDGQSGGPAAGEGTPLLTERRFLRYHRSFTLPTSVDDSKVQARLEDGVLHLTMPKRAEVKPRKIKVN